MSSSTDSLPEQRDSDGLDWVNSQVERIIVSAAWHTLALRPVASPQPTKEISDDEAE